MAIVGSKSSEAIRRPHYGVFMALLAIVVAIAVSLSSANPNYEATGNEGYYLQSGTYFLVPLAAFALVFFALSEVVAKPFHRTLLDAGASLAEVMGFFAFGTGSLGHFGDRAEAMKNLFLFASILVSLSFLLRFVIDVLSISGMEPSDGRMNIGEGAFHSFLGAGSTMFPMAIGLDPNAYRDGKVSLDVHFYLLLLALLLAASSGFLFVFLAKSKKEKARCYSGGLLALSGLLMIIDSFLIDGSQMFLYEFYYYVLAMGCAVLLIGALAVAYGELPSFLEEWKEKHPLPAEEKEGKQQ